MTGKLKASIMYPVFVSNLNVGFVRMIKERARLELMRKFAETVVEDDKVYLFRLKHEVVPVKNNASRKMETTLYWATEEDLFGIGE